MAAMASPQPVDQHTKLLDLPDSLLTCLVEAVSLRDPTSYNHSLLCRKFSDISPSAQSAIEASEPCAPMLSELKQFANLSVLSIEDCDSTSDFQDLLIAATSWNLLQAFEAYGIDAGELPQEIWTTFFEGCSGLRSLKLRGCFGDIPSSISTLVCLQTLSLGCVRLLPDAIGDLKHLHSFHLESSADSVPASLAGLSALEELKLDIPNVRHLPEAIGALTRLTSLYITSGRLRSLPQSIAALPRLMKLRLPHCISLLMSFPKFVQDISSLQMLEIPSVRDLELLRNLPRLSILSIDLGHPLNTAAEEISCSIGELRSLKSLKLEGLKVLQYLPQQLSALRQLTKLQIADCGELKHIDFITGLSSLKQLHISHCRSLESLPEDLLQGCTALQKLRLFRLPKLNKLPQGVSESNRLNRSILGVHDVERGL